MVMMLASIPSPPSNGFHLGTLFVHAYGLMYLLGLTAAIALTVRRWERPGGARWLVYDVAVWAFPAGIIGARLYNLATSWDEVPDHWWGPLAIWKGAGFAPQRDRARPRTRDLPAADGAAPAEYAVTGYRSAEPGALTTL